MKLLVVGSSARLGRAWRCWGSGVRAEERARDRVDRDVSMRRHQQLVVWAEGLQGID